jgi:hypothetical protein
MERVGIPEEQREAIFRTVAAILHMGNIQFEQGANDATVCKQLTTPHLAATGARQGMAPPAVHLTAAGPAAPLAPHSTAAPKGHGAAVAPRP